MFKREKPKGYKNAYYRETPAFYNLKTDDLIGRNWFWDIVIDVEIWIDINIFNIEYFPIWVDTKDNKES